jgi:serine/threonine-protein kinase
MSQKPRVLLIDDEERILRSLSMLLRADYALTATTDPQVILDTVRSERVHLVVSDQRMPKMRGADLLREVRVLSPATMRVLLTGYSDLDAILASINEGEIFRFVSKPWDSQELKATVQQAVAIAAATMSITPHVQAAAPVETGEAKVGILVVDDDLDVRNIVADIVGPQQPLYFAASIDEAMAQLEQHDIGVMISELFVNGQSMTRALQLLKAGRPELVTLVLTPFQDTGVIVGLINQGQVYRFLPKPVRRGPFGASIANALRHHRQLRTTPELVQRHAVEHKAAPADEPPSLSARVMSYLSRLTRGGGGTHSATSRPSV